MRIIEGFMSIRFKFKIEKKLISSVMYQRYELWKITHFTNGKVFPPIVNVDAAIQLEYVQVLNITRIA